MRALSHLPAAGPRWRGAAGIRLSPIKEMELAAAKVPGVVSLAQGIPSFDTPEPIRRYVETKIASGEVSRYSLSPGLPKLREAIAETLLAGGMRYDPESEILVSCGAIEAIAATLIAALEPGDEVLLPSPSYASYPEVIRMAGGTPRWVPLVEERNFALDVGAVEAAIGHRTKAILFSNPNNPTGTIYGRDQIERLVDLAERRGLLIVTDEVYKDFLYADAELFTPARIEAARRVVVRIFSFSKAFGMTGWRVGFLHSDRRNVAEILKVHDALVTCAPVVSQYAAIAALELGEAVVDGFRAEFRERRNRTLARLDRLSDVLDYQKPNASYFVFPRVKDTVPLAHDSGRLARDILARARVALVPGAAFGPSGESHLRISYSRGRDEIEEAFDRLDDYFHGRAGLPRAVPLELRGTAAEPAPAARRLAARGLGALARAYLRRVRPRTVGIAGLQGKTVYKRWLRELLEPSLSVRANPRSYNTEIGLPLAILDATVDSDGLAGKARAIAEAAWHAVAGRGESVLVLEMGIRRAGDAAGLLDTVVPDVLVLTPLQASFESDLGFLETVEREIAELARAVHARGGTIVACRDDPRLLAAVAGIPGARLYGRDQVSADGDELRLESGGESFRVRLDVVGESARYALLAGVEVGRALGLSADGMRAFLAGA